jgi:threonine/homoserine/homoserine lactone efflux protein
MTLAQSIAAFALAAGLLTVTPGPDTALVLRVAAINGPRQAWAAGAGISTGLLAWGLFVSLGLVALLAASRVAYDALRLIGAAYLVYLGLRLLLPLVRGADGDAPAPVAALRRERSWYIRGLLTNLLNPKVGVFYMTLLPQFLPEGARIALLAPLLAGIHIAEGLAWFSLLVLAAESLGAWLRRGRVRQCLEALTGAAFLGFGAKLALERGP